MQEDEASLYPQSFCVPQVSNLVSVSWWKSLKRVSKTSKIQNLADVMPSQFGFSGMSLFKLQTDLHEAEKRLCMDHAAELECCYKMLCGCSAEDDY